MSLRIALISEHASPLSTLGGVDSGGQNVYVAQVAKHLTHLGHAVDVFTRRDCLSLPNVVDLGAGLRVVHVNAGPAKFIAKEDMLPYMPEFASEMRSFIHREGCYDIAHANFFMSGVVAQRLWRELSIPFVITFHALARVRRLHQPEQDRFPVERGDMEARLMRDASAIIAECPQDELDQLTLYHAPRKKMRVIPCGFDPAEMAPLDKLTARRRLGLPLELPLIMQIGRLVPRKGIDTAIQGFATLVKRYGIPARMYVVGGESESPDPELTPEIGRLGAIARQLGVADVVGFTGRRSRDQLRYYYCAADAFVTTPWYEPFGITPVEAMACGTPVVGARVGGIQYTVRHGETGFLVPPRSPACVGLRLAQLLRRPQLRERMSRAAVIRANSLFTWVQVAKQIANVYYEVLDRQRTTSRSAKRASPLVATTTVHPLSSPRGTNVFSIDG